MSAPPRFFLAEPPAGAPPRLDPGEVEHALRVLRLARGDRCVGLDGRGGAWPLVVVSAGRRELELAVDGEPTRDPAPGEPGAALPFLEVAVAWPRRPRAEEMLSRLTQLGAARVTPLIARQAGPQSVPEPGDPRWTRILREAAKQCRRTWLPELAPAADVERVGGGGALAALDPAGGLGLDTWARSLPAGAFGTRERPIALVVGPEGGFDDREREALLDRGASLVRVSPHVLRIETAAEAALAVVAMAWTA